MNVALARVPSSFFKDDVFVADQTELNRVKSLLEAYGTDPGMLQDLLGETHTVEVVEVPDDHPAVCTGIFGRKLVPNLTRKWW